MIRGHDSGSLEDWVDSRVTDCQIAGVQANVMAPMWTGTKDGCLEEDLHSSSLSGRPTWNLFSRFLKN